MPEEPPRITPHPDFDTLTEAELRAEVEAIREKIKLAFALQDRELVAWFQTRLNLCFASLKRLVGGRQTIAIAQQSFWPDALSAKDFLEATPEDPDRWLWEDTLTRGSCSMLAAKPKVGKSTLAAALALSVSRGHSFLNRGVQQGRSMYVYLDGPALEIKDIFTKFGLSPTDNVWIHPIQSIPPTPQAAVAWLISQIEKFNLDFIVVDPIQKFFQFKKLDYEVVYPAMSPVQEMLEKHRSHILYLHHAGKGGGREQVDDMDSFIGSQAFRAIAFSLFHMKLLSPTSRQRILRSSQRAGRDLNEVAITDGSEGCIELIGSIEDAWIAEKAPAVKEFLEDNRGSTEKQIIEGVDGRAFVLQKTIRYLLKKNQIERTGKGGQHGKAETFKYYLAGDLVERGKVIDLFGDRDD